MFEKQDWIGVRIWGQGGSQVPDVFMEYEHTVHNMYVYIYIWSISIHTTSFAKVASASRVHSAWQHILHSGTPAERTS